MKSNYEDAFRIPKIQPATLAGVKIVFTDRGAQGDPLKGQVPLQGPADQDAHGQDAAPEVSSEITMRRDSKGFLSSPDSFTCPITYSIKAPDGVDSRIVTDYLKAYFYGAIPSRT